jgi:rhodanese-related sulfurtransferase
MRHFSAKQLKEYLEQAGKKPLLLDVRQPWEFEICAIEGSVLIPMGEISHRLDEINPEQEIVVICHHGIRSRRVASYLEHMGYDNTINLEGGVEAWARDVDMDMPTY